MFRSKIHQSVSFAYTHGVRAVVQFGVEASVLCPVLGKAMWRMGR